MKRYPASGSEKSPRREPLPLAASHCPSPRAIAPRREPLPLMPEMCGSCPFSTSEKRIRLAPQTEAHIRAYLLEGISHLCHHAQLTQEAGEPTHTCRGGRDYQLTMFHRLGLDSRADRRGPGRGDGGAGRKPDDPACSRPEVESNVREK